MRSKLAIYRLEHNEYSSFACILQYTLSDVNSSILEFNIYIDEDCKEVLEAYDIH